MIGFIGLGEVVQAMASSLRSTTGERIFALYRAGARQEKIAAARELGIDVLSDPREFAARTSIIFSAVTPMSAGEVCRSVAPHLTAGHVYIDVNSVTMLQKVENARLVEMSGADFIDAALLGVVAKLRHATPMLISGPRAERFIGATGHLGLRVKVVGPNIGQASAIKMLRSVIFKGMAALFIESLMVSHEFGISDQVIHSLQETYPELHWKEFIQIFVSRTVTHAARRAEELRNCAETLRSAGGHSDMSVAGAITLQRLVAYKRDAALFDLQDDDLDSILAGLSGPYFADAAVSGAGA